MNISWRAQRTSRALKDISGLALSISQVMKATRGNSRISAIDEIHPPVRGMVDSEMSALRRPVFAMMNDYKKTLLEAWTQLKNALLRQ